jgi:membrane protease YdiL (CAAX protease family)
MLGFVLGAFAWGALKAQALGVRSRPVHLTHLTLGVLAEEFQYRAAPEFLAQRLRVDPVALERLRVGSSVLFAAAHLPSAHPVFRFSDALAGGLLYGKAYEKGGLALSVATHLAHNLGVALGGRP